MTMHRTALVLACMACAGHARRVQAPIELHPSSPVANSETSNERLQDVSSPLQALAMLFLAAHPAAAFHTSGTHFAGLRPMALNGQNRLTASRAPAMIDVYLDGVKETDFATRTVGEVKDAFYKNYGMPIGRFEVNSFVSQILTSLSVAMVSADFSYSRIFAFGLESLSDFFMNTLKDDQKTKIRSAMLMALGFDPEKIKRDADALKSLAAEGEDKLLSSEDFAEIAAKDGKFKYTYPLGAGLLALMPIAGQEASEATIERWCTKLNIPKAKLTKDQAMYDMAVEKLAEVKDMMLQMEIGAKKKEAEKLEKAAKALEEEAASAETASAEKKE